MKRKSIRKRASSSFLRGCHRYNRHMLTNNFDVDKQYVGRSHILKSELHCHDPASTPYPKQYIADGTLERVAAAFEELRTTCGNVPLKIHCAYRTHAHNRLVGGAHYSKHLLGQALDVGPPANMPMHRFHTLAQQTARRSKLIGGLGLYDWGVHIDVRERKPDGSFAYWDCRHGEPAPA